MWSSPLGLPPDAEREPSLVWFDPASAFDSAGVNLFALLRWDYRFAPRLYGRKEALRALHEWAERDPAIPSARLVSGEGGAGKTRLAAEFAQSLRDRGWTAGFLPRHRDAFAFKVSGKGLLLILDYPEEQPARTTAILRELAERKSSPYPLRVLFLSRRPFSAWEAETTLLQGRFGWQAVAAPSPLSAEEAQSLIGETVQAFVARTRLAPPPLDAAPAWLAEAERHRLPLFVMAAALHAALAPQSAFGLSSGDLLRALAARERDRVRPVSQTLGLGATGLETLLALAVAAGGLSEATIKALIAAGACEAASEFPRGLLQTPWWRAGRLAALEPDAPAAAFLDLALFGDAFPEGRADLAEWLFLALPETAATLAERLPRLMHDLQLAHERDGPHTLEARLIEMLEKDPERARAFEAMASLDAPFWSAEFTARVSGMLADASDDPATKAGFLNNAAVDLSNLGRREEALAAAGEAVELRRALARSRQEAFAPDLAMSLNNYSNILSGLGRREEALAAAREAVGLYRALARSRPEAFAPDLAMSLNTYANRLSYLDRREEALAAAGEAVGLDRALARSRPEAFTPALASSLNNYANHLSNLGRREEALAAAGEAVGLYRALARSRPEAFTPDLAMSLNNYANRLSDLGRREEALAAAGEAVELRRALARSRPEAFTPNLASSLNNYANTLSDLGRREEALAAAGEALNLRRALVRSRPEAFTPNLASSLNNYANRLSDLGHREEALAAAGEAVGLYRALAQARPAAFARNFGIASRVFARILRECGREDEAVAVERDAETWQA